MRRDARVEKVQDGLFQHPASALAPPIRPSACTFASQRLRGVLRFLLNRVRRYPVFVVALAVQRRRSPSCRHGAASPRALPFRAPPMRVRKSAMKLAKDSKLTGTRPLVHRSRTAYLRHRRRSMATPSEAARDKLVADFKAVINDTEELLHAIAGQGGDRVAAVRARVEERVARAKEELSGLSEDALEQGKAAARVTDDFVRAHPWQAIGIAAGLGLLVGLFGRRD